MGIEEPYVGFHPTPQQGHRPCTHFADGSGSFCEQCAAETEACRYVFLKKGNNIANGVRHCPHGLAAFAADRMLCIRGKYKNGEEECKNFLSRHF